MKIISSKVRSAVIPSLEAVSQFPGAFIPASEPE